MDGLSTLQVRMAMSQLASSARRHRAQGLGGRCGAGDVGLRTRFKDDAQMRLLHKFAG